ncbi:glycosyltransferase family 9 protein [Nonlabens marinus]|uniref:LPS heptosyltransferase n=1 Tax=Nonlabens marinus S1-08 TaxID=1454201 RepID=W8VZN2_9FLAO|nr:glycosyltransferase family 9 protein [Nonlabens marinus]BAO54871.1 LPS heptosyltransferase [Nonlabens marinus S1-08]
MQKPQRIVVLRLSAMGDVAMTVPVLLAMRRLYPEVELISLSRKRFFPILQHIPGITLIEAAVNEQHKSILGLRRLAKEINEYQPDAIADLHNVLRTKILRLFLGGLSKAVIDKGRKEKKRLVNDPHFFQPLPTTFERYQRVFEDLGLPVHVAMSDVLSRQAIPQKAHSLIGDHECRWIGLAPFAAHDAKALSLQKAKELVAAIMNIDNVKVLLFGGGAAEAKELELVAGTMSNVFNMAGRMSFKEELQLLSNLDAMVSMDSGNGHLAAMYGIPVITIWGNTHPHAGFAPFLQPEENQITPNLEQFPLIPTSIYGNKVPKGYEKVMDTVDCDRVVERLKELLF